MSSQFLRVRKDRWTSQSLDLEDQGFLWYDTNESVTTLFNSLKEKLSSGWLVVNLDALRPGQWAIHFYLNPHFPCILALNEVLKKEVFSASMAFQQEYSLGEILFETLDDESMFCLRKLSNSLKHLLEENRDLFKQLEPTTPAAAAPRVASHPATFPFPILQPKHSGNQVESNDSMVVDERSASSSGFVHLKEAMDKALLRMEHTFERTPGHAVGREEWVCTLRVEIAGSIITQTFSAPKKSNALNGAAALVWEQCRDKIEARPAEPQQDFVSHVKILADHLAVAPPTYKVIETSLHRYRMEVTFMDYHVAGDICIGKKLAKQSAAQALFLTLPMHIKRKANFV